MGFHDFIKKIFGTVEDAKPEVKEEKVSFEKINDWLSEKQKDIKNKENEISFLIKQKVSSLANELDETIPVLENVDIDSLNSEKRINAIVKAGLNNYISHVKNLSKNLANITEDDLSSLVERIKYLFSDFDKKTYVNYQKATFLVDKISDIHDRIVKFSDFFSKTLSDNKETLEYSKMFFDIKSKLNDIEEINKSIYEVNIRIKSTNNKISFINERKKHLSEEIEDIKKSESYMENQKKREDIDAKEKELLNDLYELKQDVDFKTLGNLYHISEKKMGVVRKYRDDFANSFRKDNGQEFIDLLNDSKLSNETLTLKVNHVLEKKSDMDKHKSLIKPDEVKELSYKVRDLELELSSANEEKDKEIERRKKLEDNKKEIVGSIKEKLAKINVVLS